MSVYKPKNSPYYHFDFVWKGDRFHGSTGCKVKRDAERYEARERTKAIHGGGNAAVILLDDACGLYEDKVGDLPSWADTERAIKHLIAAIGAAIPLRDIKQLDLMHLVAKRRGTGLANASVNREIDVWRAIWRHAADAEFDIGRMPNWGKLVLKVAEKAPRELSDAEEVSLFSEIREDLYAFCEFALKTGWRKSEVLGLRWSDIDLGARTAVTKIKGGDVVRRPLTQDMLVIIANQPKAGPYVFTYVAQRTKPAFTDKLGRKHPARMKGQRYPMTDMVLRRPWAAALKNADVTEFRFHDLRHTRGTRILRTTGNLKAAQRALAHRSIKTTLRYAHATDDDIRHALEVSDSRTIPEAPNRNAKKA
ncbi:MAG: site-specific integrase [Sphingomonas sp.]|uniref:tyrosine-type recombinase/integrase n=1 Tax=unclassified Sphingomonas TaxID=196159 RepID=UPI0008316C62|nr:MULTISPECIES: site-specific integrase [unclassified Sphingomonas]PZU80125.1 MAG: site-specific integrase [Sphingomonas sp.]